MGTIHVQPQGMNQYSVGEAWFSGGSEAGFPEMKTGIRFALVTEVWPEFQIAQVPALKTFVENAEEVILDKHTPPALRAAGYVFHFNFWCQCNHPMPPWFSCVMSVQRRGKRLEFTLPMSTRFGNPSMVMIADGTLVRGKVAGSSARRSVISQVSLQTSEDSIDKSANRTIIEIPS